MSATEHTDHRAPRFGVVVLAASYGGLTAYRQVLSALPAEFPVPVVLTLHRSPNGRDRLAAVLDQHCKLPVRPAEPGTALQPGVVHVVPAGRSSVLAPDGTVTLDASQHDGHRSGDSLLTSAAACYGRRTLAVVLTGRLDDAAAGARAVKRAGGRVLAQDPVAAEARGMPDAALATGCVDFPLPLELIADSLVALVMAPGAAELLRVSPPPWAQLAPSA